MFKTGLSVICFALLLAILVESSPLTQSSLGLTSVKKFQDDSGLRNRLEKTNITFDSLNFVDIGKFAAAPELGYRLPNDSIPLRYDIQLHTDVDKGIFEFSGRVAIHIRAVEPTQQITLQHRQLTIDKIDLFSVEGTLIQSNLRSEYIDKFEFLKIDLPSLMNPNDEIVVELTYSGTLRDDRLGFYRASYFRNDDENDRVWFATTQFSMTEARHAMPCYDEPGIRAIMQLQIQHDKSYMAISNTHVMTREAVAGTDYVITKFQETPKMQSYILGFIVSDFDYISNNNVNVEQRVYAKAHALARGEGAFMLSVVDDVLITLEALLKVPFPLSKMDHAAITEFAFNAMENNGLITYREPQILFNPDRDDELMKLSIIDVLCHEYAHHYFGNMVSIKWWAWTWMKEGFATLYQYYIPQLIYPDQDWVGRFRERAQDRAFAFDVLSNDAKPLNYYVESPVEVRQKFDTISYQKGSCILRMMQEALTVETFTKGLTRYLNTLYYQTASPDELHEALQYAYDEDYPNNPLDLATLMYTWENQAGYPIIRVQKSGSRITLSQSRFGGGDEIYTVPLTYTTRSDRNFMKKTPAFWMSESSVDVTLSNADDWVVLNVQLFGYFKVSYDKNAWHAIFNDLRSDHEMFPTVHRRQFFIEMASSMLNEPDFDVVDGLELMGYLDRENQPSVWSQVIGVEEIFTRYLFGTNLLNKYQLFIRTVVQSHLSRLGFEDKTGEPSSDAEIRSIVSALACQSYHEECLNYELEKLKKYLETGTGSYNLCDGLRRADQTVHTSVVNEMLNAESNKIAVIRNLGCSLNKDILKNYLMLTLDTQISLSSNERTSVIEHTLRQSVIGLETSMDFVLENMIEIEEIIAERLKSLLNIMATYVNSNRHYVKLVEVLGRTLDEKYLTEEEAVKILANADSNMKWINQHLTNINNWLTYYDNTPQTTATPMATEATTEGSGSLIASFIVVVLCACIKMFI